MKSFAYSIVLAGMLGVAQSAEIDTDHLFAFNVGTDIGSPGEKEIHGDLFSEFGRAAGTYAVYAGVLGLQYTPVRNFVLDLSAAGTSHQISNVPGMDDRHSTEFAGLSLSATYRLMERSEKSMGLALHAEPFWARVDDQTGEPIDGYGADFRLVADKDIVADQLVAVVNLRYQPFASRSRLDNSWSRDSTFGISGGLMQRLFDDVFGGLEARYFRHYHTLGFNDFAGQALFLGPTLSVNLSERAWFTAGWSSQVVGSAADQGGALDLVNFSRHEIRLAVGTKF